MSNWFSGRSDDDFRDELDAHLAEETERQMRQAGLGSTDAHFAARRAFGNVLGAVERFHDSRSWAWTERIRQHVRYALRALVQRPAFSLTAISSLGIGIGFMTAIFTVFYALSVRDLPVRGADTLVNVYQLLHGQFSRNVNGVGSMISYVEYQNYRAAIDSARAHGAGAVSRAAVYAQTTFAAETRSGDMRGEYVSCNYFDVLRVRVERGRGFRPDECAHVGDPAVAVLSHGTWAREFGSDTTIVGRVVRLNQVPVTVIGVAERGFGGITFLATGAWVPVTLEPVLDHGRDSIVVRDWSWMFMVARLAPGASVAQARAQLAVAASQRDAHFFPGRQTQVVVTKASLLSFPEARSRGALVAGMVTLLGFVLVVMVSANIMNLLLARGIARRREIGIRLAIGASRGRLVEQLLTESLMIALLGGAVGYALAHLLPGLLPKVLPVPDLQINLTPDSRILGVTLFLSLITALVFGLVPALHATDLDLLSASKGALTFGRRHIRTSRLRGMIVGVQVAGSAVLLIVSTLFIRATHHAAAVDPGYTVDHVATFGLNLAQLGYSPARGGATLDGLRERMAAYPGVEGVGIMWPLPLLGRRQESVTPIGGEQREALNSIAMASVSPTIFQTLGIHIVAGRAFTDADVNDHIEVRPAVVSQSLATALSPDGNAVGASFKVSDHTYVVTGIAADTRFTSLADDHLPFVYMPPVRISAEDLSLVARTRGSPAELERLVGQWAREVDPGIVVHSQRLSDRVDLELRPVRVASMIAGAAGALAMFLALIGIYGVVSYAVSQQTREIAIRQALGATRRNVVRLVFRQGARPIIIGLAAATALALVLGQLIQKLLFGVSALDPLTYAGVAALLMLASAAAMYGPARRAVRISPAVALRED